MHYYNLLTWEILAVATKKSQRKKRQLTTSKYKNSTIEAFNTNPTKTLRNLVISKVMNLINKTPLEDRKGKSKNQGQNTLSKMEQNILANGKTNPEKDMENRFGQMVLNTKDSGKTTWLTARVDSGMLTETYMKAIGRKTKRTATVFTLM